jgi:uncharacterized protein YecT (DUF1311 family)
MSMNISALILSAALVFSTSTYAEEGTEPEPKHPLDVKIEKLAEAAGSTAESTEVFEKGQEMWDKELNRVYQELKKILPEKSFATLKDSQLKWIAFRDAQIAFINSCYDHYDGTMYIPMRASAIMEVTRARALDLTARLEFHKEHKVEE